MKWPYHVEITFRDGRVRADDYSEDFDPLGYARKVSERDDVERVTVTVAFSAGRAVDAASLTGASSL